MRQTRCILLLVTAAVAGTSVAAPSAKPASVGEPRAAVPAIFREDGRLRTKISVAVKDEPLQDLLAALSQQTSVRLTAGPETADDKLTLFVDERPSAEVLSLIARQFRFHWLPISRGYELRQEGSERAREAVLRDADLDAEWAELRAWTERLERLARTPRAQLQERAEEISRRIKDSSLAPEEHTRLGTEAADIRDALRPETASAVAVLQSLTPAQVAQLRKSGNLLLSGEDGSLSPRLLERVRQTPADEEAFENPLNVSVYADAMVALLEGQPGGGPPRPGDRRTHLYVQLIVRREREGKREWGAVAWSPLLPAKERTPPAVTPTDDPVLNRLVELRVPALPRPAARPGRQADSALTYAQRSWPARPTLGDVAQALHTATGLELLADRFVRSRVDPKWISERQPVAHLLDSLARELEYTWQKEGNLLLLQSRSYYRDRAGEVPKRVIRPWQERAARPGGSPLDDFADLAAVLSDLQTLGMSEYWGWYLEEPSVTPPGGDAFDFHRQRRHLRFWASLNPAQRKEALSGATIPAERMSEAQRRAFLTALNDPEAAPWDSAAAFLVSRRSLTPTDVLSGGFSLKMAVEWNIQLFEGEKPGEERTQIVAQYPTYRPPNIANLPQGYRWSLLGPPCAREDVTFAYFLGGEPKPARTASLGILRPRATP